MTLDRPRRDGKPFADLAIRQPDDRQLSDALLSKCQLGRYRRFPTRGLIGHAGAMGGGAKQGRGQFVTRPVELSKYGCGGRRLTPTSLRIARADAKAGVRVAAAAGRHVGVRQQCSASQDLARTLKAGLVAELGDRKRQIASVVGVLHVLESLCEQLSSLLRLLRSMEVAGERGGDGSDALRFAGPKRERQSILVRALAEQMRVAALDGNRYPDFRQRFD